MLKKILIGILAVVSVFSCKSQNITTINEEERCHFYYDAQLKMNIYDKVDIFSEYNEGMNKFIKYITDDIALSPEDEIITKVIITIIIDKKGNAIFYVINNKKEIEYSFVEKEIKNRLDKMGLWIPAKCKNIDVTSIIKIPVHINYQ
jgi:hypothetical protein